MDFYKKAEDMFEQNLKYEEVPTIKIKDLKNNKVLHNIDYKNLLRFDSNLNIYKMQNDGSWVAVNNDDFKAIVICDEIFF